MALTYDQSYFLAFAVEAVLWGAYLIIFNLAVYFNVINNRKRRPVNKLLFGAMIALFVLCTTHFSLVFYNVYQGLMIEDYAIGVENHILIGADILNYITDLLGQMVLIYRCWYVWGKCWSIVILPLLMSCTSFACAMTAFGLFIQIDPNLPTGQGQTKVIVGATNVALGLPVGTDLLLTLLIVGRIWYASRWMPELLSSGRIHAAISIIIESGAAVIIVQFVLSVLVFVNSPGQNVALSTLAQIYGIAPTLIILRIGLGKAIDTTMHGTITSVQFANSTTDITFGSSSATRTAFTAVDTKIA